MRIVFSSSDVSKVRQLEIREDHQRWRKEMRLDGDRLSITGFESAVEYAFKARMIHHLTSLQEIYISGCSSVVSFAGNRLPAYLQKLTIKGCRKLEFPQQRQQKYDLVELLIEYSCDSLTSLWLDAFPNLKNLQIRGCENLESVSMIVSSPGEGLAAPNLTHLHVSWCLKFKALPRDMNSLLPNLVSLDIRGCPNICRSPEGGLVPNLKELSVGDCEQQLRSLSWLGNLDNLTHLTVSGHGSKRIIKSYPEVGSLPRLPSLTTLEIWGFKNLETLNCNELLRLNSLQQLDISFCEKLKNMEEKMFCTYIKLQWNSNYSRSMVNQVLMRIVSSSSDVSKVRQLNIEDGEKWSKKMRLDGDRLSISGFESVVECAFKARIIHHLNSLQEIYISWSESVVSLGGNCLPKSLQKLTIFRCHRIELLQQQQKYDLVDLQIYESCDSLTSLSLDAFPTLNNLQIKESSNLESVSMSEPPHASLQRLTIFNCSQLVSFPQEGLATPNLTHLHVSKCSKLEALPPGMNTLLPNLESLDIQGCPNICRWPEGGLPANLKKLSVRECEEQVRGLSWLGNLDNLTHLTISGRGSGSIIKSYPEVGSLPHLPSLTTLEICWFKNLETLECNELLRLTSLQQLHISSFWKLENMAGEKLPPSLLLLRIRCCSLLEEHCKNKHQLIWPKISHIPTIKFVDF
ncbi:hypothetical protein Ahy_A02g009833 [Arachis hypogaea]|uniref:Disease resistance protein n=1 Tax=Arachis hypogaea TaxID=3818 RepID=A0A445EI67_ARAHY|nr:hypothetical protein Ahy_A02g009833 [Arachis hypogaea]